MNSRLLPWIVSFLVLPVPVLAQFSISGTVRNAALVPVAGVRVVLWDGGGIPIGIPLTLTNAAGFYSISPLPSGAYIVGFEPPTATRQLAERVPVTISGASVTLDRNLAEGVILSGMVTDSGGTPIPDIDLKVEDRATNELIYTPGDNTDVAGFYDLVIPAGEFDITWRAVAPGALPWIRVIRREVVTTDTIINIQMIIGVFVSGHVTRPGAVPVAEVNLDFTDVATGLKLDTPGDVTDLAGFYQVHVPPATYEVRAKPAFADRLLGVEFPSVAVAANQTLDVVLTPGVGITGVVTSAGAVPEPAVEIEVRDATGAAHFTPFAQTDLAGVYAIVVPSGLPLTLDFIPPVAVKLAPVRVGPVAYATDQIVNVTASAGRWLLGTVTNASLAPVPGVDLDLKVAATGASVPVAGDVTDALGSFTITVAPGIYTVEVEPAVASLLVAERFDQPVLSDVNLAVQLDRGVRVYGNVTDPVYLGVPGYRVEAFNIGSASTIFTPAAVTNAVGAYEMVVPAPATYRFTFFPGAMSGVTDTLVVAGVPIARSRAVDAQVSASTASGVAGASRPVLELLQNHPNPFNPRTSIRFRLAKPGMIDLRVFDVGGAVVRRLRSGRFEAGEHVASWDGRDGRGQLVGSGVYFCRLAGAGESRIVKMILLK